MLGGYLPFPVWLATCAALIRQEGFDVVLRDSISMGETYASYYAFVEDCRPDVILLETSTPAVNADLRIAAKIRQLVPGVRILFTGLHVEHEQVEFLQNHPEIDFTIYGEYESPALKLLCALRDGTDLKDVPALIYRDGDHISKTAPTTLPDISKFPWAERESLPNQNYFDGVCGLERPQLQLMATRGCPYGCIFCAWPQMLFRGPHYRMRDPQDVVDEIKENLALFPYKSIYIDDDTFNINKQYVVELATKMKEAGIGGRIPWSTMGRADLMDEPTLAVLRDAGLFSIKYGVESAEQGILDEIDKRMNAEKNIAMIKLTKEYGIRVHLTFTFGLPSDTVETIERTIDLACSLPADTVQFSIATPFPGTEMYRIYKERGWVVSTNWDDYNGSTVAVSRTENFTAEQLEYYVVEAYRRFNEAQMTRCFTSEETRDRLKAAASTLKTGDRVVVMQTSRVPFTSWIISTLDSLGLEVHLVAPLSFSNQFTSVLAPEKIHTFSTGTHFHYLNHREWLDNLQTSYNFKGVFIPYSFDSRDGYADVERLAGHLGETVIGMTLKGQILPIGKQTTL